MLIAGIVAMSLPTHVFAQTQTDAQRRALVAAGESANSPVRRAGRPVVAFKGCKEPQNLEAKVTTTGSSRVRSRNSSMTDPTTARVFASFDIDSGTPDKNKLMEDCRYRLDGVWEQDVPISFDDSRPPTSFGAVPGTAFKPSLAYASYTTPVLMYVTESDDAQTLTIRPATSGAEPLVLVSRDGVPMSKVMVPDGAVKTYVTTLPPPTRLLVDVSRTGKVRLRWAGRNFLRPVPTVTQKQDVSSLDVFAVNFNLHNLAANRRGYDIVTQNAFELNDNGKAEIFAAPDPKDYAIVEQRTVPLGLKLIPEGVQGTVTSKQLISRQFDYQKTEAASFGVNIGFTQKSQETGETLGSLAAGASYASQTALSGELGSQHSVALGFARHKLYTLVLDEPFAKLSDAFIDAVDDARRYGRYRELIEKFGTHYAYAVTYGSQARMWASFTQSTVAKWRSHSQNVNTNAGLAIGGFKLGTQSGRFTQEGRGSQFLSETSNSDFEAVGGTGSFSAEGHATGTSPYPILADLRPIYELLNPLYFPKEPEVYTTVREKLKQALIQYLEAHEAHPVAAPVVPARPAPGLIRIIAITTHTGSTEHIRVTFGRARYRAGLVRVCMINHRSGYRRLAHGVPHINPFVTRGAGARSCATFPANAKLSLSAAAGNAPARVQGDRTLDLAPYADGYVNFDWIN